ncbi:MAG: putative nickel-responsive regulator [Candidatus Methanofastidiosum methylothiophilum]|uniref:Putative nickel-responsive regulator n=1 Tax=Candidatus Methanofastidiosum methylothiophilum TaxID=1705564 RepID=A0A150J820_9EURY|nr:MAG: putative nickel-responsive regulator [Candidatus Methanofastidiosum methylthiophilus]
MSVISISINDELLEKLDKLLHLKGFSTRSEIFREALREYVTTEVWEEEKGPLVVTGMVISSKKSESPLNTIHHKYEHVVETTLHTHLDEKNCLEIFILKGDTKDIKEFLNELKVLSGVKAVRHALISAEV